jgi:hypothetical protein
MAEQQRGGGGEGQEETGSHEGLLEWTLNAGKSLAFSRPGAIAQRSQ